jgi:hypothetical protein
MSGVHLSRDPDGWSLWDGNKYIGRATKPEIIIWQQLAAMREAGDRLAEKLSEALRITDGGGGYCFTTDAYAAIEEWEKVRCQK